MSTSVEPYSFTREGAVCVSLTDHDGYPFEILDMPTKDHLVLRQSDGDSIALSKENARRLLSILQNFLVDGTVLGDGGNDPGRLAARAAAAAEYNSDDEDDDEGDESD